MQKRKKTFNLMSVVLLFFMLFSTQIALAAPPPCVLTTETSGLGTVDPSGGTFSKNTTITITAIPDAETDYVFDHWEGSLSGNENPKTLRMNSSKHVKAVFIDPGSVPPQGPVRTGLRSSPYGIDPFPSPAWWVDSATDMASHFTDSSPAVVWIVGEVMFPTMCRLSFPNPTPGVEYPDILFMETDENEVYLDLFDASGVKVWLQIEPGNADIETCITMVLNQYSHHSSVIGFGVDVEWFQKRSVSGGKPVTDTEAINWTNLIKSYDTNYILFLKHWEAGKMPPTYRDGGIVFVNDSQGFRNFDAMIAEFTLWGQTFSDSAVGFQYGYSRDKKWWKNMAYPPGDMGNALRENIPNTTDLIWVDFTADIIWPIY